MAFNLVSRFTSAPISLSLCFVLQNTSCIGKPQVISWRGGAHPLHPPPRSIPVCGLYATLTFPIMHHICPPKFCILNLFSSFLLGITAVPREVENKPYANFRGRGGGGAKKVDYGNVGVAYEKGADYIYPNSIPTLKSGSCA